MKNSNKFFLFTLFISLSIGVIYLLNRHEQISKQKVSKEKTKSKLRDQKIKSPEIQDSKEEENITKSPKHLFETKERPEYFSELEKKLLRFQPEGSKVELTLMKKKVKKQGNRTFRLTEIFVQRTRPNGVKNSYVAVYNEDKKKIIGTHSRKFFERTPHTSKVDFHHHDH